MIVYRRIDWTSLKWSILFFNFEKSVDSDDRFESASTNVLIRFQADCCVLSKPDGESRVGFWYKLFSPRLNINGRDVARELIDIIATGRVKTHRFSARVRETLERCVSTHDLKFKKKCTIRLLSSDLYHIHVVTILYMCPLKKIILYFCRRFLSLTY